LPDPKAVADKASAVMPPDLSKADVSVRRSFGFQSDDDDVVFEINGVAFDPAKVTTVLLKDSCEEWTLEAIDGPHHSAPGHPFHVHVNPFQVLQVDDKPVKPYWSDTIFIHVGHSVTVRTKFRNFTGKTVLHCHILDHEDAGMMHGIFIEDPGVGSPNRGGNAGGGESPVPPLGLSTPNGKLDLAGASGATVLVFFQGATCPSCLRQLKAFVEARRSWGDGKVRLVAVSSDTIADRERLGRILGVQAADPVEVCEDPKLTAFKKMGCEDDGPLHGTFLIKDGKVVWGRIGFTPFANVEVLAGLLATRGGKAPRAPSP
jgi:peroxiredoxin